jgi:hypothetical protein
MFEPRVLPDLFPVADSTGEIVGYVDSQAAYGMRTEPPGETLQTMEVQGIPATKVPIAPVPVTSVRPHGP